MMLIMYLDIYWISFVIKSLKKVMGEFFYHKELKIEVKLKCQRLTYSSILVCFAIFCLQKS